MNKEDAEELLNEADSIMEREGTPNVRALLICDTVIQGIESRETELTSAILAGSAITASVIGFVSGFGYIVPGIIGILAGRKIGSDSVKSSLAPIKLRAYATKAKADKVVK